MNKVLEYKGYKFYYDNETDEYFVVTNNNRVTYNWTKVNKKVYNYFKQVVPKRYRENTTRYLKRVGSYYGYCVYLDMNDANFMLVVKNGVPTRNLRQFSSWVLSALLWYKENYEGKPFNDVV